MSTQTKIARRVVFPVALTFWAVSLVLAADKGSTFDALVDQLRQAMNAGDEQAADRASRAMDQLLNHQSTQPLQKVEEGIEVLVEMYRESDAAEGVHGSPSHRRQMEAFSLIHRLSPPIAQSLIAEAERNGDTSTAIELRLIARGRPSGVSVMLAVDKAETASLASNLLEHEDESVRRIGVTILRQSLPQVDARTQNELLSLIERRIADLEESHLQNELLIGVSSVLGNPNAVATLQRLVSDHRLPQPMRDRVQLLLFSGPRHSTPIAPSPNEPIPERDSEKSVQ